MTNRRWWVALLDITAGVGAVLFAQSPPPRVFDLAIGLFGGTDQEIAECTFSIGQGASLVLHPNGNYCIRARELIGRTGTLMFVLDEP